MSKSNTTSPNNLMFGGHENDNTGLSCYHTRYYLPVLQRYISEDPIGFGGGDTNLYRYVGNNPHVGSDATGLCGIEYGGSCDEISDSLVYESGGYRGGGSPYKGYRPEGFTLSLAAGGPLVAAVPAALPVLAGGVEALIFGLGVTVKFLNRAGLFSTPGPGPQPALDGSVFMMNKPTGITDPKLQDAVDELFREGAAIPGGTAGAIREENRTGQPVRGKFHRAKGEQRARSIKKMLGRLGPSDRAIAERVLQDLQDALGGK